MCKKNTITGFILSLLLFASMCQASYTITIKTNAKSVGVHNGGNSYSDEYFPDDTYVDKLCSDSVNGRIFSALFSGGVRVITRTTWDNGKTDVWTQWESICNNATYDLVAAWWSRRYGFGFVTCWVTSSNDKDMCGLWPIDMPGWPTGYTRGIINVPARTLTATRPRLGRSIVSTSVDAYIVRHSPFGTVEVPVGVSTTISYIIETPDITIPSTVAAACIRAGASVEARRPEESGKFDITISNLETPPTIEFIPQIPENMTGVKAIFHDSLNPQSTGALKIEPVENGSVKRTGYFELKCGDLPAGQYDIPVIMNVSVD
ncbi:hypothetical protein QO588_003608 [Salmonella enterica]|nr:hypothetical protein [Salmonella enterica]EGZ4032496.1 hypothetical protein [Salmonella enterica subsp. enterica serovar Javiana]HCX7090119.1 hypothetical protein [Salmonella enterica subsp. enterica]ECE1413799.1 hypothetical protein [Salmonella enterica]ELS7235288.1 hypothetical protein [Salmonella enterica]